MKRGVTVFLLLILVSMSVAYAEPAPSQIQSASVVDWLVDWWNGWLFSGDDNGAVGLAGARGRRGRARRQRATKPAPKQTSKYDLSCPFVTDYAKRLGEKVPANRVLYKQEDQRACLSSCGGPCRGKALGKLFPQLTSELKSAGMDRVKCWVCEKPKITCVQTQGQACGCENSGITQCDGSCKGAECAGGKICELGRNKCCDSKVDQKCGCGDKGTYDCAGNCISGACPTAQVCSSGNCCNSAVGQSCNRNQCGGSGIVNCDGSCSANAPNVPGNLGQSCNRNQCGGSGTITCSGTCSTVAPVVPSNLGQACGCGGTIQCNGACSRSNCASGQNCVSGNCVTPVTCSTSTQSCGCGGSQAITTCTDGRRNVGGCSRASCASGQSCVSGQCTTPVTCSTSNVACGCGGLQSYTTCTDRRPAQYGACSRASCSFGQNCVSGRCTTPAPASACSSSASCRFQPFTNAPGMPNIWRIYQNGAFTYQTIQGNDYASLYRYPECQSFLTSYRSGARCNPYLPSNNPDKQRCVCP